MSVYENPAMEEYVKRIDCYLKLCGWQRSNPQDPHCIYYRWPGDLGKIPMFRDAALARQMRWEFKKNGNIECLAEIMDRSC